jgi:hypothetical protein
MVARLFSRWSWRRRCRLVLGRRRVASGSGAGAGALPRRRVDVGRGRRPAKRERRNWRKVDCGCCCCRSVVLGSSARRDAGGERSWWYLLVGERVLGPAAPWDWSIRRAFWPSGGGDDGSSTGCSVLTSSEFSATTFVTPAFLNISVRDETVTLAGLHSTFEPNWILLRSCPCRGGTGAPPPFPCELELLLSTSLLSDVTVSSMEVFLFPLPRSFLDFLPPPPRLGFVRGIVEKCNRFGEEL